MRALHFFLFWILFEASITAIAAGADDVSIELATSIPPEVLAAFEQFPDSEQYQFSSASNPFFIQGDFNGDKKLDTAIRVIRKSSGKVGLAIIHGGSRSVLIMGAGKSFGNAGDDFSPMEAWYSFAKGAVRQGVDEAPPHKLKGDAIMILKPESASALIYWTGNRYAWYQQRD